MESTDSKRVTVCLISFAICSGLAMSQSFADALRTSRDFDSLPTAVKSYVVDIGVEQGLKNPADVTFDRGTEFLLPVPANDLNNDGKPDYYVAACMFAPAEFESIYQTNGFPCASAALILSGTGGGYERIETLGPLINAKAGTIPMVSIAQRNHGDCGEETYTCKADFTVELDEASGRYILKLKHISPDP